MSREQELLNIIGGLLAGTAEALGHLTMSDHARAKETLLRAYEAATGESPLTPDPGIRGRAEDPERWSLDGQTPHDRALLDAGYDPRAMTAAEVVEAHARGLLPGLCPGVVLSIAPSGTIEAREPVVQSNPDPGIRGQTSSEDAPAFTAQGECSRQAASRLRQGQS